MFKKFFRNKFLEIEGICINKKYVKCIQLVDTQSFRHYYLHILLVDNSKIIKRFKDKDSVKKCYDYFVNELRG